MLDFFENTILVPIRWAIEAILWLWHSLFSALGLNPDSGLVWVLSIIGVVVIVRALMIPVFVKQIKSQRKMLDIAPEMKKIQKKYQGKKDQFSRQAQQQEMMALYKKHGTNPMASCFPLLVQMPIFFALYSVLRHAASNEAGVGLMNTKISESFNKADLFGAPLKMTFTQAWEVGNSTVIFLLALIMVLMVTSQFYTQLQIISKNISDETKESAMYKNQKIMLFIIPIFILFSGFGFAVALNIYWFTSNIWTMVQQSIVINQMPTPGSEAYRKRQAKLSAKGKMTDDEKRAIERAEREGRDDFFAGQRQQPMSAKRAKKQGGKK